MRVVLQITDLIGFDVFVITVFQINSEKYCNIEAQK